MPSIKDYIANLNGDRRKLVQILTKHDISATEEETFTQLIPKTEGITVRESDVNFYDYDGTLVYAYTKADFLNLASFPANPSHTGLTAQGWNWTFNGAKDYVTRYGYLDIGQNYVTSDGSTKLYITIDNPLQLTVSINLNVYTSLQVDWGDGSAIDSFSTQSTAAQQHIFSHTYQTYGDYVIKLIPNHQNTRTIEFWSDYNTNFLGANPAYTNTNNSKSGILRRIELGRGIASFSRNMSSYTYALRGLYNLESISVPIDIPNYSGMHSYNFADCTKLKTFVFPLGFVSCGDAQATDGAYTFDGCNQLTPIICETQKFKSTGYRTSSVFSKCNNIKRFFYPLDNNTSTGVLFTSVSNSATSLVVLPDEITRIENSAFSTLSNADFVGTLPSSLVYLGSNAFYNNNKISKITIPDGVTTLNASTFEGCIALSKVTIEGDITSIGNQVFNNCTSLFEVSFLNCTAVPTLGSSVFNNTPNDLKILVPEDLYNNWIAASNWSTYASKIYPVDSNGNVLPKPE